ncbi:MAG: exo-alpha-sialidase [Promethearchaeota archaeon]
MQRKKDKTRIKGRFWKFLLILDILIISISLIFWFLLIGDKLIYYPALGFLFIFPATLVLSIFGSSLVRIIRLRRNGINYNPKLRFKAIVGIIPILFSIQFPIGQEFYFWFSAKFQNYSTSPYDSNIGEHFIPEAAGVIYSSIPGAPSAHCSSLIYLPNGSVFAVWFAGTGEKHPDVAIYGSYCTPQNVKEGGSWELNWTTPQIVADTPNKSEGNPILYLTPNGRLYLFYQTIRPESPLFGNWGPIILPGWSLAKIKMKYSDDFGKTWSEPVYFRNDYWWVIRCPPIVTTSGAVIIPVHREAFQYQAFFLINPNSNLNGKWKASARLRTPNGCLEPTIVQLNNGKILCLLRTLDKRIYYSFSDDDGYSWRKAKALRFPNPNSQIIIRKLKSGNVLMACNPQTSGRNTLSLILGDDTGEFWSEPHYLFHSNSRSFSYPNMIQLPDDSIILTYTNNRENIGWVRFNASRVLDFDINFNID